MLQQETISVDTPQWSEAVAIKRERAFRQCVAEGFARAEAIAVYDAYAQECGIALHDQKLREENENATLCGWRRANGTLAACATVRENELLGDARHKVLQVVDLYATDAPAPIECRQIIGDLLARAADAGASSVQMCDIRSPFWDALGELGGNVLGQTTIWHFPERIGP